MESNLLSLTPFSFTLLRPASVIKTENPKEKQVLEFFRSNLLYYIRDFFKSIVERNIKERSSFIYDKYYIK